MTRAKFLQFLRLANAFRQTPIVDDDFPLMRDRFDFALADLLRELDIPFPTVVTLCGSTRFMDTYIAAARAETLKGNIVISVGMFGHQEGLDMASETKAKLDQLHCRKIDISDEILVLNDLLEGIPYIGQSTRREIEYAKATGKRVRYLNPQ